ncbi:hypothetical protein NDU88_004214 [Pleurodeles waltl]|uniref:Uncharacterized protein n=1 Tax=Pleurodeles waltl TaxID=8319 RepID=A0AAV7KXP8_PLEWA|nr:hypothetical protein NDU88_004214 [Pleurodeles waltl]
MCRLTGSVVEGTVGAAGVVLWSHAALELRKTRSAVACFPLRGRSSGRNSSSGRVSTSTLLTLEQRVDDGAYGAYAAGVKRGSSTAQTAEETVDLVRGRGRRRRGKKSLGSSKETGPTGKVNTREWRGPDGFLIPDCIFACSFTGCQSLGGSLIELYLDLDILSTRDTTVLLKRYGSGSSAL